MALEGNGDCVLVVVSLWRKAISVWHRRSFKIGKIFILRKTLEMLESIHEFDPQSSSVPPMSAGPDLKSLLACWLACCNIPSGHIGCNYH